MSAFLVTGAAGFIGSALVKRLIADGHTVHGFDLAQGDITLAASLLPYEKAKIDHVFHLAGRTFVPESWADPAGFFRVNVLGTLNVLELCRITGAGLTYISSYLYGSPEYLPIDEKHPVKSYNPYSYSKVVADQTCQFYQQNYKVPVTILRPFNAYGPGQTNRFLIAEIISKVMDETIKEVEVMDLRPKRDYVYIDDLVEALVLSLRKQDGIFNIGSGISVSVEEITDLVMKHSGISKPRRSKGVERPNEIFELYADISKAGELLGWTPATSIDEGIRRCIGALNHTR